MLQTAQNQGAWPSQWSWGNKNKKKKIKKAWPWVLNRAQPMYFVYTRCIVSDALRLYTGASCLVRGWWRVSWISLWWPSSVYPHTFCVLYQRSTTAWYFVCVCVCVCSSIVFEIKIWATQNGAFFRRSIFPLKCRFSVLIKLATMARTVLWSV